MAYPTMDQYNDAVQHPQTAFSDPALKFARIATNGMGLPIALGGGFALTYTAANQGRKFAVRCFHKEATGLEAHYGHVDKGLRAAGGSYFVGFEYQPTGVLVNGTRYPIVKMDWVEGSTLGTFLEDHYSDRLRLERLRSEFNELERFLRSKGLAHGDLQNGNVLVKSGLKLIDYDGVYAPGLPIGRGTELGHKHFQHPKRSAAAFGPNMDRFSFILIDLSLRAVAAEPTLFSKYSNGENIILTANDLLNPASSSVFADLKAMPALERDATNFASICAGSITNIPSLEDFLAARNIPAAAVIIRSPSEAKLSNKEAAYVGAYEVVDASNYAAVEKQVGNRVELVGRVAKVHVGKTRYGKPFAFVFILDQSRSSVKLNVWSEGMASLNPAPSESWVGTWLSVQGLIDPAYTSKKYGASLSVTITSKSQLRVITENEAGHRLASSGKPGTSRQASKNRDILAGLSGNQPSVPRLVAHSVKSPTSTPQTTNQAILQSVKRGAPLQPTIKPPKIAAPKTPSTSELPWGWIIFGIVVLILMMIN